jgi:hypothetical protein
MYIKHNTGYKLKPLKLGLLLLLLNANWVVLSGVSQPCPASRIQIVIRRRLNQREFALRLYKLSATQWIYLERKNGGIEA